MQLPYYEKNSTVLWTLTPEGIVLHNFVNRQFVELKGFAHLVWAYLDGVHRLEEIHAKIMDINDTETLSSDDVNQIIQTTFEELLSGQFIVERVL